MDAVAAKGLTEKIDAVKYFYGCLRRSAERAEKTG
jgi:hypothetical protein